MKLCQKCNSEIDRIFIVKGENLQVYFCEESECEFWAHKTLYKIQRINNESLGKLEKKCAECGLLFHTTKEWELFDSKECEDRYERAWWTKLSG